MAQQNDRPSRPKASRPSQAGRKTRERDITAAYIGIGNELLSGSTQDANFYYLARSLRKLGIQLMLCIVIPDEPDVIQETIQAYRTRFTYIFTSGGLGPTHDDVTVEGVALALGVEVVRHPFLEKKIREFFGNRLEEASLKMAEVPKGSVLHFYDRLSFPVLAVKNIYLLPGIPELFREKFEAIKEHFQTRPYYTEEILCNRRESEIADLLSEALDRFPSIKIGSYPRWREGDWRVKVVVESKEKKSVERAANHLRKELKPAEKPRTPRR